MYGAKYTCMGQNTREYTYVYVYSVAVNCAMIHESVTKRTTTYDKHKQLNPHLVASYDLGPGNGRAYS